MFTESRHVNPNCAKPPARILCRGAAVPRRVLNILPILALALSACTADHRDLYKTQALLDSAEDPSARQADGMNALTPRGDDPSVAGLGRTRWQDARLIIPLGMVEHGQTYRQSALLHDTLARDRGMYPSPESAIELPREDERTTSLAEGFYAPLLALFDAVTILPRMASNLPNRPQYTGLTTGGVPRRQVEPNPTSLGIATLVDPVPTPRTVSAAGATNPVPGVAPAAPALQAQPNTGAQTVPGSEALAPPIAPAPSSAPAAVTPTTPAPGLAPRTTSPARNPANSPASQPPRPSAP
ncbi:hypothetical protein BH11PLA1_BH11PLA1_19490 [soil metagenome]